MNTTRGIVGAVLAIVLAVGTGCATPPAPSTPTTPTTGDGVWEKTLSRLGPDGTLGKDAALAAFTLAAGPVPGVARPAGDAGEILSGTAAVSSVLAHWPELTEPQREAVSAAIGTELVASPPSGGAGALGAFGAPARNPNLACQTADSADAKPYRAMVEEAKAAIAPKFGRPLRLRTYVSVDTREVDAAAWMYTFTCVGREQATSEISGCTIHVTPDAKLEHNNRADVQAAMIHEVMHCFLYDRFGLAYYFHPLWYREGFPTWAASVLGPPSEFVASFWKKYLKLGGVQLNALVESGLGFFAHHAELGLDTWAMGRRVGAAMGYGGPGATAAGFRAAALPEAFLNSWGSGFAQGQYPGTSWTSVGPNLPRVPTRIVPAGAITEGGRPLVRTVPSTAAEVVSVQVEAEVVQVSPRAAAKGRISLGSGADVTLDAAGSVPYCTLDASRCECPSDSARAGVEFGRMKAGMQYLGITGGADEASVSIGGQSLEDFCASPSRDGRWRLVSVSSNSSLSLSKTWNYQASGGAGIVMALDKKGRLTIDYGGMQPIKVSMRSGHIQQTGTIVCSGTDAGSLRSSLAGSAGPWSPAIRGGGSTGTITYDKPARRTFSQSPCGALFQANVSRGGTWKRSGKTLTILTWLDKPDGREGRLTNVWTFAPA